jgi:DNA-directed RNA polymerase specialized sigma subunit
MYDAPRIAERDARIVAMRQSGATMLEIAGEVGISKQRVSQICRREYERLMASRAAQND